MAKDLWPPTIETEKHALPTLGQRTVPRDLGPDAVIVDEEMFALVTELEIRKALRLHYPVSLVAIVSHTESSVEIANPRRLAEQLASVIRVLLRATDLVRLPATSSNLQVLLVGARLEHVDAIIQRIREEVSRHLFQLNGVRKAISVRLGSACFPTTASTSEGLQAQAEARAREAPRDPPGPP